MRGSPAALETDPTILLALGAISSYLLFAIGWVLYGIASLRSRAYPAVIGVAIVIGGAIGFQALLSLYGVPLGLAVGAVGVSLLRRTAAEGRDATTCRVVQSVGRAPGLFAPTENRPGEKTVAMVHPGSSVQTHCKV